MVNLDQQRNLLRQTQNETRNVRIAVTLWCVCVTIVDMEK